jgi:hypothetical protein
VGAASFGGGRPPLLAPTCRRSKPHPSSTLRAVARRRGGGCRGAQCRRLALLVVVVPLVVPLVVPFGVVVVIVWPLSSFPAIPRHSPPSPYHSPLPAAPGRSVSRCLPRLPVPPVHPASSGSQRWWLGWRRWLSVLSPGRGFIRVGPRCQQQLYSKKMKN